VADEDERARHERARRIREQIAEVKAKKKKKPEDRPRPKTPREFVEEGTRREGRRPDSGDEGDGPGERGGELE